MLHRFQHIGVYRVAHRGILAFGASAFALAIGAAPASAEDGAAFSADSATAAQGEGAVAANQGRESASLQRPPIIVTANRRETTVFDTAAGLTALSGDYLNDNGLDSFVDYSGLVPSLDFVQFAPGRTRITMRGVSADPGINTASTVSVYLDDVPVTSPNAGLQLDFRLYDVERVEVLRGPQGTLFGENSMGGAIRLFTNDPDPDRFEGSYQASVGFIEHGGQAYQADAMLNIPLAQDVFALRVVGSYRSNDGWIDNITTGEGDVNSNEIYSGRASIAFTPSDVFSLIARVQVNRVDVDSLSEALIGSNRITNSAANSPSEDNYEIFSGDVRWDWGFATLESITGYIHRDVTIGQSEGPVSIAGQNGLLVAGCVFGDLATGCTTLDPAATPLASSVFTAHTDSDVFTQEVHLVSPDDQRFRWIIGGFYRSTSADTETFRVTQPPIAFANAAYSALGFAPGDLVPGGYLSDMGRLESEHYAGFVEASFDITPTLEITAGVRVFHEEFDYLPTTTSGLLAFFGSGFTSFATVSQPFSSSAGDANFKAEISWRPTSGQHYYAVYSEGFRSGGANGLAMASPNFEPEYQPDTTRNYELGAKWQLADNRIDLSTAVFYTDWSNLQVNDFDLTTGVGFIRNGGEAHVVGIEAEVIGRINEHFSFTLNGSLIEAETDNDISGSFAPIISAGARLPNVPEWSYGASLEYVQPLGQGDMDGVVRFDVRGQGASFSALERYPATLGGFPLSPQMSRQNAYHIANIRAGIEAETWSVFLYLSNLWNETADLGDNNFGMFHRNQPRTVGLVMNGRF